MHQVRRHRIDERAVDEHATLALEGGPDHRHGAGRLDGVEHPTGRDRDALAAVDIQRGEATGSLQLLEVAHRSEERAEDRGDPLSAQHAGPAEGGVQQGEQRAPVADPGRDVRHLVAPQPDRGSEGDHGAEARSPQQVHGNAVSLEALEDSHVGDPEGAAAAEGQPDAGAEELARQAMERHRGR